jgi:hypothetical protein
MNKDKLDQGWKYAYDHRHELNVKIIIKTMETWTRFNSNHHVYWNWDSRVPRHHKIIRRLMKAYRIFCLVHVPREMIYMVQRISRFLRSEIRLFFDSQSCETQIRNSKSHLNYNISDLFPNIEDEYQITMNLAYDEMINRKIKKQESQRKISQDDKNNQNVIIYKKRGSRLTDVPILVKRTRILESEFKKMSLQ